MKRQAQNQERMASLRQSETCEQSMKQQAQNQERMASLRQSETCEQSMKRQAQNQERMASLRQSETCEQSMKRQAQNQERMASLRQSETCEQSMKQQAQNQERMASLRLHCSVSIATHQIAEWRTCANQLTPRVLHFSALVGVCLDAGSAPYIIMPYMANGSLLKYLKKERMSIVIHEDIDEDDVRL